MRIFIVIAIGLLLCSLGLYGQNQEKTEDKQPDRIYWGIYFDQLFSFRFGQQINVQLAPFGGYRFTKDFSAGLGGKYIYFHSSSVTSHTYGGALFMRYIFLRDIHRHFPFDLFAHTEYELLNARISLDSPERECFNHYWIGGGLSQSLGGDASLNFTLLWNLNDTEYQFSKRSFRLSLIF